MTPKSFGNAFARLGKRASMPSSTRTAQAWLRLRAGNAGHEPGRCKPGNIQHTVRYTELAPDRFKDFRRP
jgi:hypothetical protein